MRNEYELAYSKVSGDPDGLYADYIYGFVLSLDYARLIEVFTAAGMDDEADEVRNALREIIMYDEEDEEV